MAKYLDKNGVVKLWSKIKELTNQKLTINLDCDHEYEITGKTGHEYAVAVPDGQVLIKRINGQTRRKSLNLFKSNGATDSRLTVVENDDGSITLNGTGGLGIVLSKPIYVGKSYTVLLRKISGSMVISSADASTSGSGIVFDNSFLKEGEVKYYSSLTNTITQIWVHENATYTNYRIQLMVVEGNYTADTMPPFEPFDDTLVNSKCNLKSTGRNYFTLDDLEQDSGSTITPITKSEFTRSDIGNRNSTAWVNFLTATYNRVGDFYLCFYADSDIKIFNFLNFVSGELWTNRRVHITSNSPNLWMANEGFSNITVRVMVSKEEITYEPYEESSMLVDKELGEFDYIDNVGHLLVKQTSEVITLDGSSDENWAIVGSQSSGNTNLFRWQGVSGSLRFIGNILYSNIFGKGNGSIWGNDIECIGNTATEILIRLSKEKCPDLNSFKTWLASANLQVVFKLSTPTTEPINLEAGYQVWNSGLQIQETETIPYVLEKEYAVSLYSQILAITSIVNSMPDDVATKTWTDANYISNIQKGQADGVVPLNSEGKIESAYLPPSEYVQKYAHHLTFKRIVEEDNQILVYITFTIVNTQKDKYKPVIGLSAISQTLNNQGFNAQERVSIAQGVWREGNTNNYLSVIGVYGTLVAGTWKVNCVGITKNTADVTVYSLVGLDFASDVVVPL